MVITGDYGGGSRLAITVTRHISPYLSVLRPPPKAETRTRHGLTPEGRRLRGLAGLPFDPGRARQNLGQLRRGRRGGPRGRIDPIDAIDFLARPRFAPCPTGDERGDHEMRPDTVAFAADGVDVPVEADDLRADADLLLSSRATAWASVSPTSTTPPGRLKWPISGARARRTIRTCLSRNTAAETARIGRAGNSLSSIGMPHLDACRGVIANPQVRRRSSRRRAPGFRLRAGRDRGGCKRVRLNSIRLPGLAENFRTFSS